MLAPYYFGSLLLVFTLSVASYLTFKGFRLI